MRNLIAAALVALGLYAAPATAQTVSGCSKVAANRIATSRDTVALQGDIDCARTAADRHAAPRLARIAALTPAPTSSPTPDTGSPAEIWVKCAEEYGRCTVPADAVRFRYGGDGKWGYREKPTGTIDCTNTVLGDPAPHTVKACWYKLAGDARSPLPNAGGFKLGVNLSSVAYWSGEPTLANLVTGGKWNTSSADVAVDPVNGITLLKGQSARLYLTAPPAILAGKDTKIVCTWEGSAVLTLAGGGYWSNRTPSSIEMNWMASLGTTTWMDVSSTGSNGMRNLDCRVASLPRDATLSPEVVDSLKPFKVLRFLDWSSANGNPQDVTWDKRTQPGALVQSEAPLGVAIEHQVALAKATGAAPWFNVPWNADADYQRRMAQLVHDSLPADREVYVELSNEVWNDVFLVTHQARKEALAEGLSTDQREAVLLRYAEKVRWMMPIWSAVFADRPGKLVRIAATQVGASNVETLLGKGKLAGAVDAVAIAPYIGGNLLNTPDKGVAADLAVLAGEVETWEAVQATEAKAVARRYNTRVVMYEGGQHLTGHDVNRMAAVNRAAGMEAVYRSYIATWRTQVADTMVLFNSTSKISQYGAWGLKEYVGQPLSETPKLRAALEAAGQ